jgi:hypothetical protein
VPHGRFAIRFTAAALLGLVAASSLGQDAEPTLPSLDDLLGLEGEAPPAEDANRPALERKLTAQQAGEQFEQAVQLMGDAAARIGGADLGLQTQRLQEEIIRKLDQVIEAAGQSQGGGGSSSSSGSSGQNQQQPNQGNQAGTNPQPGGNGDTESMAPGLSGVETNPELAPDGVTWGNLPQRDREAVSQGVTDRYSALYRRLTELYYRRLAERDEDR